MTEATSSQAPKKKLLLVSSSGGHLKHLTATSAAWQDWAYYPTTRNIKNAIRNLFLAFRIFPKERPDAVVSAGAGVAVPFFVAAKLFGVKTLYIECFDRPTLPTMTGKMLYTFADRIIVQSEEQQENFPDSRVIHPIF